jgi:hypothetical protein
MPAPKGDEMSVDAQEETDDVVHLTIRGRLTTPDQAALVYFITKAVQRHGRIRLLITLDGFAGWTADDEWGDDALRIANDATIVKTAFVGDARWRDEVFAFVGQPFRAIPMEYFMTEAPARAWLAA